MIVTIIVMKLTLFSVMHPFTCYLYYYSCVTEPLTCSHFTDKETEKHRIELACPRSQS